MNDASIFDRISRITEAVQAIINDDFTSLLDITEEDDAIDRLADAVNRLAGHVQKHKKARQETEDSLADIKKRFKKLHAIIPGIMYSFVLRPDGSSYFPYVNDISKDFYDLSPEEIMRDGTLLSNLIHPDDKERFNASVQRSAETLQPWRETLRFIVNEKVIWHDCISQPQLEPNGNIVWDGVTLDITDRMIALESLKESEKNLSDIISASPVGIAIYDKSAQCISVNDSMAVIVGATKEILLKQNYRSIASWEETGLLDMAETAVREKTAQRHEMIATSTFGKKVFLDAHLVPFGQDGVLLMAQDITERKQNENALRNALRKLQNSQKLAQVGSWEWDLKNGTVEWSDETYAIFGLDPETFQPQIDSVMKQFHPEDRKLHEILIKEAIENRESYSFEARILLADGSIKYLTSSSEGQYDEGGNVIQISGAVQDITERKKVELELSQSERFLNNIIDQNPYPLWISDEKGTLIHINKACCDMLNIREDEIIGNYNVLEDNIVIEQGFLDQVQSVFTEGETANFILEYNSADLKIFEFKQPVNVFLDVTISPIKDDSGRITNAVVMHKDITEQKLAEAALRNNEERLLQAVRVSNLGIFDHDHLTDTMYWSPKMYEIHDWDPDVPISFTAFMDRVCPDDKEATSKGIRRSQNPAYDGVYDNEHRFFARDGSIRYILTRSQTFFEGGGDKRHPVRSIGAVRNITKERLAEETLRKTKAYSEKLLESANALIVVLDSEANIKVFNRMAEEITGYSREEVLGHNWFDIIVPKDKYPEIYDLFLETGHEGLPGSLEIPILTKAGDECFMSFRNTVMSDDGIVTGILTYGIDITQQKQLEKQLLQSQKMEAIGQLAGGVAHDFNNMLSVILGYAELIKSGLPANHPLLLSILEIEKAGLHSRDITRQLLAFSRKQIIAPIEINLNKQIKNIQKTVLQLIGENIELHFLPGDNLWKIKFDSSQIDQILINLAVNARDAMPDGGILTIETSNVDLDETYCSSHMECVPGQYVLLEITDNGTGIDKEMLLKIFEPFFTTKELGKGTGLGLATVYGIVKQNDGFIDVYSEPGEGTSFQIHIPRIFDPERKYKKTGRSTLQSHSGTILLVEDDILVRRMANTILEQIGYTVIIAETPREALDFCEKEKTPFDLLITDVVMPQMNGTELSEKINMIRPGTKVLFMSGYTENVIVRHGVLGKGLHFIQKPFSMKDLAEKVRNAMDDSKTEDVS